MTNKKYFLMALAPVAAISLVACSETGQLTEGTVNESKLTLKEVFDKALAQQENLQSASADMDMQQKIVMPMGEESLDITSNSNLKMDMHNDPLSFYVDGTMTIGSDEEAMDIPLKMYMTEADGLFMNDQESEGWMKFPDTMVEDMLKQIGAQGDATEQLEQLKPFVNDFTFEQSDTEYILTLNAEGEKFNELILANAGSALENLGEEETKILEGMTFEGATYMIKIDKETFNTKQLDFNFIINMEIEGQTMKADTKASTIFSKFNEVNPIVVPDEVINTAVEF